MGSNSSKVRKGVMKSKNEVVRVGSKVKENKAQLSHIQNELKNNRNVNNVENVNRMLIVTEKAKVQLERDEKPLTKNDLIAILVALNAIKPLEMESVEKTNTVGELISMIRGDIYDPSRFVSASASASSRSRSIGNGGGELRIGNGEEQLRIVNV